MNRSLIAPEATTNAARARLATAADVPSLSSTLASAFFDDPVFAWCYPDAHRRFEILPLWFEAVIRANLGHEEIHITGEVDAGAVWLPPNAAEDPDLAGTLGAISGEHAARLFEAFDRMEQAHPHEPHYYLFLLGARRERQSCGLGSVLLSQVLAKCDRNGSAAYLEATSHHNVRLYRRHGFEIVGEIELPNGPSMWPMWRNPRD